MQNPAIARLRALRRAAELVGGNESLAACLGVTFSKLDLMLAGLASIPDDVFLQVVDIINDKASLQTCAGPRTQPSRGKEAN